MHNLMHRFRQARDGVAAAEFAVILPVLILIMVGTAELGNALLIDRKVTRATQVIADLVAQQDSVTTAQLDDIMQAADEIIRPFPANSAIVLTSVIRASGETSTKVDWSVTKRGQAYQKDTPFTLPSIELDAGTGVIVAEISFSYTALFPTVVLSDFTIRDRAFLRPRKTNQVTKS